MACPYCKSLQINPDTYIHQRDCPDYGGQDKDADILRNRLNGVELGMWADTVLTIHPKNDMVKAPKILGKEGLDEFGQPNYVIEWTYNGFTLTLEHAIGQSEKYGNISVYAVQEIRSNNEQKRRSTRKYRSNPKRKKGQHSGFAFDQRKRPGK